jgi:hypothetical protein
MTADSILTLRSPADVLAAVPYLLGFHPQDSIVVVAVRRAEVIHAARYDLGASADTAHVAAIVARQGAETATIIGYGPAAAVAPEAERAARDLTAAGVAVHDVLRVAGGRWWSCTCTEPLCCPPEGRPCEPTGAVAAAATYAGHVALPDRAALVAQVAPATGPERAEMVRATAGAERRLAALLSVPPPSVRAALGRAGRAAVRHAARQAGAGGRLTADETAWLAVLLVHLPTRDLAWSRIGGEPWQVPLWTDVLRRAEPPYVPAPACLLAFAAWRAGHGALASAAVDRALAQDPAYSMAVLLEDVLRYGLPPSALDGWPVPARPPVSRA